MARSEISIIRRVFFEFTPVSIHPRIWHGEAWERIHQYQCFVWQSLVSCRDTPQQQSWREIWPVCPLHHVHISMAYFSALGQTIESSGGPEILSSAEVLAQGTVRGFIHGHHFIYCTQIHPLFALALQILHFRHFIEMHGHGVLIWWMHCFVIVIF